MQTKQTPADNNPKESTQQEDTKDRIKTLVQKNPIMLFMKGSPEAPQCGFSALVVHILRSLQVTFHHFDVLSDENMRQGIKDYTNWPTIPQLYIKGEFIGGSDIVREQFESGELQKQLT